MSMTLNYRIGTVSFADFQSFLSEVDKEFVPPILSRIDINAYYEKLSKYATLIECYDKEKLVGISASYDNNYETKHAFVTFIAVLKKYRGNNIAGSLLAKLEEHAKASGMKIVGIDTNNEVAKACYIKNGYKLKEQHLIKECNLIRYYLEKEL